MHNEPICQPQDCARCYLDIAGVLLVSLRPDGTVSLINKKGCEVLEYDEEEIVGQDWFDRFLPDEDREKVRHVFSDLLSGKEAEREYETNRVVTKSGRQRWIRWHNAVLRNPSGRITGTLGAGQDVTTLVETEAALRSMEGHWKALLRSARDFGVYRIAVDHDRPYRGTVLFASPSVEEILCPRDPLRFETWFTEIHPQDKERAVSANRAAVEEGKTFEQLMRIFHRKRGEWRWIHVVSTPTLDAGGKATYFNGMMVDVTKEKQAEQELIRHKDHLEEIVQERTAELRSANEKLQEEIAERRRAQEKIRRMNRELEERVKERTAKLQEAMEELKQLDRMKDAFVSSVSHELRTPLTSIRSFSELLLQCDEDRQTQKEFLDIINTESERLTHLINDVLDVSRIASGKIGWSDVDLDLRDVLEGVLQSRQPCMQEKGIRLSIRFPKDIPQVHADPDRIHQVIDNLLQNAIKFSHRGGEIVVWAEKLPGRRSGDPPVIVRFGITDEGIGVDPADSESIFDRFRQVSADFLVDKPQGTGLGLSICREIVFHYGGNIWVESNKGEGSTFYFTLPALEKEPSEPAAPAAGEGETPRTEGAGTPHTEPSAPIPSLPDPKHA